LGAINASKAVMVAAGKIASNYFRPGDVWMREGEGREREEREGRERGKDEWGIFK
jgi:hypothetical protein